MERYTVKQLARLSGVSVRTLHYYDEIGLLKPAEVGANGYRYYGRDELLRLQQILLHRELGLPLDTIATLLESSSAQRAERLRDYRQQLVLRIARHNELIATVDLTIASLEGEGGMRAANLYKGFSAEKQAQYEEWIVRRYASGDRSRENLRASIDRSRKHTAALGKDEIAARMQQLATLEAALAGHCLRGTPAGDTTLVPLLENHRAWVAGMWGRPCPPGAYAGLADLYESHPDFRARYEMLAAGFADYLPTAMRAYSRSFSISADSASSSSSG
jgi:MerR family transcriptional regulator, thiopeptide resistance regulator